MKLIKTAIMADFIVKIQMQFANQAQNRLVFYFHPQFGKKDATVSTAFFVNELSDSGYLDNSIC